MAQQTAVEWLIEEIKNFDSGRSQYYSKIAIYNHAYRMEKEQMYKCASFWRGKENEIEKPIFDEYYKETYNK